MNRFDNEKNRKFYKLPLLVPILFFIIMLTLFFRGIESVNESTIEKQKEGLEIAVKRSMAQCYAVEGAYPDSIDYIVKHYGLMYDKDQFLINYEYYGSNLLPEVTIIRKSNKAILK